MREYVIMTDSTSDLTPDFIEKYNIKVSLLSVLLDGKVYKNYPDEREISNKTLYASMRSKKLPTTSAVNINDFLEVMEPEVKAGRDILYIGFSSAMSSTYNTACVVAKQLESEYPGARIITVDSLSAALSQGLLVYLAALEKQKGKSIDEVAKYVEDNRLNMCHSFTVDDLFHIMRGGRATKSSAILGSLLSIKPILRVNNEGLMDTVMTVRGRKKAFREIVESIRDNITDVNLPVFIGHGDCEEEAKEFADLLTRELGLKEVYIRYIGAVCGCHGGPGLIGAFYHGKSRDAQKKAVSKAS